LLTFGPEDYKPLPAHSKLIDQGYVTGASATCGVDVAMTACVLEAPDGRHGFVLSPQGSWTF
jgi:hypothetical protein